MVKEEEAKRFLKETLDAIKTRRLKKSDILKDYCTELRNKMEKKMNIEVPEPVTKTPIMNPDDVRVLEVIAEANGIDTEDMWKPYQKRIVDELYSDIPEEVRKVMEAGI